MAHKRVCDECGVELHDTDDHGFIAVQLTLNQSKTKEHAPVNVLNGQYDFCSNEHCICFLSKKLAEQPAAEKLAPANKPRASVSNTDTTFEIKAP
jgi:hypothetical protein